MLVIRDYLRQPSSNFREFRRANQTGGKKKKLSLKTNRQYPILLSAWITVALTSYFNSNIICGTQLVGRAWSNWHEGPAPSGVLNTKTLILCPRCLCLRQRDELPCGGCDNCFEGLNYPQCERGGSHAKLASSPCCQRSLPWLMTRSWLGTHEGGKVKPCCGRQNSYRKYLKKTCFVWHKNKK